MEKQFEAELSFTSPLEGSSAPPERARGHCVRSFLCFSFPLQRKLKTQKRYIYIYIYIYIGIYVCVCVFCFQKAYNYNYNT